jgi:hypothetical protein
VVEGPAVGSAEEVSGVAFDGVSLVVDAVVVAASPLVVVAVTGVSALVDDGEDGASVLRPQAAAAADTLLP